MGFRFAVLSMCFTLVWGSIMLVAEYLICSNCLIEFELKFRNEDYLLLSFDKSYTPI